MNFVPSVQKFKPRQNKFSGMAKKISTSDQSIGSMQKAGSWSSKIS